VARLEAGKREPSRETVGALAGLLDCDADETVQLFVAAGFLPPGRWVVRQGVVMLDGDA
jgi:transcriptional regulator with XRE-family HTH domain